MATPELNRDYERRPYWHATMPALADRRNRPLPDSADVVVVGGGYTGVAAARRLAQQGATVTLVEANELGWGASTRNGGIVHPGYKWGPQELVDRYGEETGRALFGATMDAYELIKGLIADEQIDCEFRERGYLDVAWAPSHADDLRESVEVLRRFGDITILVNNAGITRDSLLLRMRDEQWDQVLETDLKSAYRLCKLALRPMVKARAGRIVNVTSVVGATGNAGQSNYAAAKAGLIGFSKSLAREVGSRGITVNCVAPGFIDTDMTRALGDEQRKALLERIPLGRLGESKEVAACVAFLVSDGAAYITGTTLHVDGGNHAAGGWRRRADGTWET